MVCVVAYKDAATDVTAVVRRLNLWRGVMCEEIVLIRDKVEIHSNRRTSIRDGAKWVFVLVFPNKEKLIFVSYLYSD